MSMGTLEGFTRGVGREKVASYRCICLPKAERRACHDSSEAVRVCLSGVVGFVSSNVMSSDYA